MPDKICPHCGSNNIYLKSSRSNQEHRGDCLGDYEGKCVRETWFCRDCKNTWTRWTCEGYEYY